MLECSMVPTQKEASGTSMHPQGLSFLLVLSYYDAFDLSFTINLKIKSCDV